MKTLLFFRHAKAEPAEYVFSDRERRLTNTGREQALLVARKIKEAGIHIDLILSSPALRALETAEIAAIEWFGSTEKIQIADTLYDHSDDVVINAIRQLPDQLNVVCLFGHNPGFESIPTRLNSGVIITLPTGGVAHLFFETSTWSTVLPGTGQLQSVYTPADKVKYLPEFAPAKSRAEKAMLKSVQLFTKPLGEKSMSKIEKLVRSMSDKFIKQVLKAVKEAEKQATADAKAAAKAGKPATKKRGRKPAAKAAAAPAAAPKKRGRKPAAKAAAAPAAAPKKRGRKPAAKAAAAPAAAPKKRGRKPAAKATTSPASEPKKRGRKPAAKAATKAVSATTAPKKRGRKPAVKTTVAPAAAPKKRGAKPGGAKRGRKPKSAPVPVVVTPDTPNQVTGSAE